MSDDRPSSSDSATVVNASRAPEDKHVSEKNKDKPPSDEAEITVKEGADIETLRQIETHKLSWVQVAFLVCGEYVVIAILAFPSSYAVLGWAGGFIATILIALCTLWTSHILWRWCMRHPNLVDITTLGRELFGGSRIAYELTTLGLVLNNEFIMALHLLSGGIALNTLSNNTVCTIVWTGGVMLVVMFSLSLFRELKRVAAMSLFAASTMLIALIMTLAFAGAEDHPAAYDPATPVTIRAWAAPGTTFVAGMNAVLNITYTFVGQILIPSFVQDMAHPEDFPKALFFVTAFEVVLFSISGGYLYSRFGSEYVTSPAYGSLRNVYAKAVAGMTLPTLVVVGVLYSVITSRIIYYRIFSPNSVHVKRVTTKGTIVWVAIVTGGWLLAFIIGESIPFFNDLLSLMSSLFDCQFGFIFWGVAYFRLYGRDRAFKGTWRTIEAIFSIAMIIAGLYILGAGTYTSVQAIRMSYANNEVAGAWTCDSTGF